MSGLRFAPLHTADAEPYWRTYLEGRTDVPSRDLRLHLDRYLSLPPEEQRSHLSILKDDELVGTVRLLPDGIAGFSLDPAHQDLARPALLKAVDLLRARGLSAIEASYEDRYAATFEGLGFRPRFSRMRMEGATKTYPARPAVALKPPEESEVAGLAVFLRGVYEGHPEQEFGIHVGSDAEWTGYVTGVLKGDAGRFMPEASFVAMDRERIVGSILMTHWMGSPLIAEVGVAKDRRQAGLGRALLEAASSRLAALGEGTWSLYVTLGNDPAIHLYDSLGFTQIGGRTVTARLEAPEARSHS